MLMREGRLQNARRAEKLAVLGNSDQGYWKAVALKRLTEPVPSLLNRDARIEVAELGVLPLGDLGKVGLLVGQIFNSCVHDLKSCSLGWAVRERALPY